MHEIDTVNTLSLDLKRRFGTDWIEHKSNEFKFNYKPTTSDHNLQVARKGFSLPNNTFSLNKQMLTDTVSDFRDNSAINVKKINIVMRERGTQTGGIIEDIMKMCSIQGIEIDKIFLPGENEQLLNSFLSKNQKFIQLHHIDTKNKRLMKIKIFQEYKQEPQKMR